MMKHLRLLSIALLVPFTALTVLTLYEVGFVSVLTYQFATVSGVQVFSDLAIACLFFMIWMVPNAKQTGRNPWPYVVLTLTLGSFGPLLYFAFAPMGEG